MIEKINELNKINSDEERLLFCRKYNKDFKITLDNDNTSIVLNIDYNNWDDSKIIQYEEYMDKMTNYRFDKDFGNRDGIPLLFKMLDIPCQYV